MDTPRESLAILNHPIYWFEDGSLILDVEVQRFRVHRTLLSRHSKFFSTLSEFQTTGSQKLMSDNFDTSSVNHVVLKHKRQVRAQDVEVLLQHLYHDVPLGKDASFAHVTSLLRVSSPQQLDFPSIHDSAREIFEAMFPNNPDSFTHDHPLHDALTVATDLKLSSVRKAILYSLVTTTDFDVSGAYSGDQDPQHEGKYPPTNISGKPDDLTVNEVNSDQNTPLDIKVVRVLSPADAAICMSLMTRLIEHFTPILFTPTATPHMACTDVFAETWMPLVIQPAIEDDGVYKPLETLQRLKEIDWVKHGLCASCVVEKKEEWTEEQRNVWELMDRWLEPPPQIV